jgi:hypothetical protein
MRRNRRGAVVAGLRHVTVSVPSLEGVTDSGSPGSVVHGGAVESEDSKDHETSVVAERRRMERA